ncbi:protein arginine methyltransferase NDUFAF7, mitochondrial isoform X2 [Ahaetulla prasina]|uniref:protein arginine methyltransferase NDUFAF7, mitochondrial isoform X2 n=1 Tax=Ahaetulla prasina TaxID=499056 RepID=UPI0026473259|nr:protein arginine methyltransferase NDUFAF7, mitochondrial isoform X2 [Ahaetulla prasina]
MRGGKTENGEKAKAMRLVLSGLQTARSGVRCERSVGFLSSKDSARGFWPLRLPRQNARVCAPLARSFSTLLRCQHFSSENKEADKSLMTPMLKHLIMKIKSTGPITVAEYMREVLTNPLKGYYMHQDMFGEQGDFVTSPEISQIFGELIGIWFISEWMATGKSPKFQLVELGPGRGSLIDDILRVLTQLSSILANCEISIHLVEVSPKLSEMQASVLIKEKVELPENSSAYMHGISKTGIPIFWYRNLNEVPEGNSFYLAHEFLDALPIHKFQKTENGWRELFVDIDPEASDKLRFVLALSATPASKSFIHDQESRDHVEVCPDAGVIIQKLASNVENNGGAALIIDYGHDGTKTDTFRGFRGHKLHDVFLSPGSADLTADVDFSYLRRMVLLQNADDAVTRSHLLQGYQMLMDKMGERFYFFALLPHYRLKPDHSLSSPVAGFGELLWK